MRRLTAVIGLGVFAAIVGPASAQSYGKFVGTVRTEWLDDGRKMRLLEPFAYVDHAGLEWPAPAGSVVDGASIPKFAWSIIGGPFEGRYREASVIHDVACDQRSRAWEAVHEAFYYAMRTSGVEHLRARVMYAAVYYFGPRWSLKVEVKGIPKPDIDAAVNGVRARMDPGSRVEVVDVQTRSRSLGEVLMRRVPKADVVVAVHPPAPQFKEADFGKLRERIEQSGRAADDDAVALDEIRRLRPTD